MKTVYTITCGKVPSYPSEEDALMTFNLSSVEDVKAAASDFIMVFPAELGDERKEIAAWDGTGSLTLSHQDDDYFIFRVHPAVETGLPAAFTAFVDAYKVEYSEEEESEEDGED